MMKPKKNIKPVLVKKLVPGSKTQKPAKKAVAKKTTSAPRKATKTLKPAGKVIALPAPKKPPLPAKTVEPAKVVAKKAAKKAAKKTTAYFSAIGRRGGLTLKKDYGSKYFSELGRRSHPRESYNGGRPKGSKSKPKD